MKKKTNSLSLNGVIYRLELQTKTAMVVKCFKPPSVITIPQFVEFENEKYMVKSIGFFSFDGYIIDLLAFSEDSEVEYFNEFSFSGCNIKKLQIPPKLKYIGKGWCQISKYIGDIEVSPKNKLFKCVDHFLMGKSDENSDEFDILYNTSYDAEELKIPSSIKILNNHSFASHKKLKSVIFSSKSKLREIQTMTFLHSSIQKIVLPSSVEKIDENAFESSSSLLKIEIIPKKKQNIALLNDKILVTKSKKENKEFDVIVFAEQDIKNVEIPSHITKIYSCAFFGCKQLESIEFQGSEIILGSGCFPNSIKTISFPNVTELQFEYNLISAFPKNAQVYIKGVPHIRPIKEKKSYSNLILMKCLRRFEKKHFKLQEEEEEEEEEEEDKDDTELIKKEKENIFIDDNDESHHKVISKIGEGATSNVYKIIDERNDQVMCKKVIKVNNNEDNSYFKLMKNSLKEIEILFKINDPCICQAIGINIQEKIHHSEKKSKSKKKDDDDEEEEEDYESDNDENQLTTVALFFEYLPHSLKKCLEMNILSNTLKTKIAIEVAFGMLHIHSMGMMHRDLKIENVMLNEIFEAKIIDFGLAHDPKIAETKSSLTKGIGTFAYMSPEMLNEENYDNKTDVYSYGIFLFVLFTGSLPKQTLKEKVANKPFKFPHHSSKISKFCIKLIKNCISVEPNQRPSFDQIIDNIAENEFKLAPELKKDIIEKRYKELNLIKSSYSK